MKIEYPILWIDDNKDYYETLRHDVVEHIESHGMIEKIVYSPPTEPNKSAELVKKHNPYLVVVDYNLGGGLKGDQIIKSIRGKGLYHEILFYSQDGFNKETFSNFFASVDSPLVKGVNLCAKGNVAITNICNLIDLKLSQVADISTQRGWIVADAIELEHQINIAIQALGAFTHELFQKTLNRLLESPKTDFGCRHQILQGGINDLIKSYNSSDPKNPILADLKRIKLILKDFRSEIIELRNSIAHQPHYVGGDGKILITRIQKGAPPIIWEENTIKSIRSDIRKHKINLNELLKLLNPE